MVAKKRPVYEEFGDELSPSVSLLQAANLLDISAFFAVESRDTETLSALAVLWMRLGDQLMHGGRLANGEDDDDESEAVELLHEPRQPVGFAGPNTTKEIEVDE